VVKELIQKEFNPKNLKHELKKILSEEYRKKMFSDYFELENKLGGTGASEKTARLIYESVAATSKNDRN
ncbi:MAG TPA: lipid-A-disaccharide synthase, partial [Salinimicrobium sp.]|nr:lipid-A-disaccharide synthase [Salinimicrobium sp.]